MRRRLSTVIATFVLVALCVVTASAQKTLMGGVAKSDITPPIGTPLAGYGARRGAPSTGVHDPTEARALILDNGVEKIALVSVDHLGFDHGMVERIRAIAAEATHILPDHIFVMSSHTHSGGGAFMEMLPLLANVLAGKFDPKVRALYEQRTADAIIAAGNNKTLRASRSELAKLAAFRASARRGRPMDQSIRKSA